ncbi:MAG: hypothetical protein AW10_02241 [Candidatus Accumulibacter appositus]|uniref:Uncharacterized protein n=1 Tax=Candidatus Accumulibacter appositus TaxID=1454003 RepID=A0A011NWM3_9PROT|nr:hypothetical protein [Accumulibacter sp.]EXI79756.1 MAG: hypothetical protein AW10_02241 [Candidatus Accumulibacter appositus]HRF05186.1 hypothetical protein [Accumulibacter sp.]
MRKPTLALVPSLALVWALLSLGAATAQTLPAQEPAPRTALANADIELLKGAWLRPDGGYTIVISNVGASGQLEAIYFNPRQLPFAKAQASRTGGELRAFFELRAGGYDGSTYDLTYDAGNDRLTGTYYQAVARQKFDIFFVRKK